MQTINRNKKPKPDYQDLQDELEERYGPDLAQQIVDEIRKVERSDFEPNYTGAKAVSEALELFRGETREVLRRLQKHRSAVESGGIHRLAGANVADLETERLRIEFEKLFNLYFQAQKGYYDLFWRSMFYYGMKVPPLKRYKKTRHEQEMTLASSYV